MDRWDVRENQMIAVLTQPDGDVTVTDGLDQNHQIPSFPSLQKLVLSLVDDLTGEVSGVRDIAAQVTALAGAAGDSAAASATSADQSEASATRSDDSASASATSATASATSATASEDSRQTSDARANASALSAQQSAVSATQSAASAQLSSDEADDSAASASTAVMALGDAVAARTLAQAWAVNAEDVPVETGEFSAKHWAKKAQSFATGSLVYLGAWDASSNTLPPGAKKGAFYKIVGTGTVGGVTYRNGDNIVHNGTDWDLIDNTETVTAVAGKVGNVTLAVEDIGSLVTTLAGKASINHTHAIADVIGLSTALAGKASLAHTHAIADVTGLQTALDGKVNTSGGLLSGGITLQPPAASTTASNMSIDASKIGGRVWVWVSAGTGWGGGAGAGNLAIYDNTGDGVGGLRFQLTPAGDTSWYGSTTYQSSNVGWTGLALSNTSPGGRTWRLLSIGSAWGGGLPAGTLCFYDDAGGSRFYMTPDGGAYFPGWVYAANFKISSDLRLKKNTVLLNGREELEKIKRLLPMQYDKEGNHEYGFGAQHFRMVYPTMVSVGHGAAGADTHTVSVSELLAPLVAAVQELDRRLSEFGI